MYAQMLTLAVVATLTIAAPVGAQNAPPASAQAQQSPKQDPEPSVWITRINPPISVTLEPGTTIRFVVDAEYTLSAGEGRVALYIQGAESQYARIASDIKPISQGSGTVNFIVEAKIPPTRRVEVITALYAARGQPTSITDSRVFEVLNPAKK